MLIYLGPPLPTASSGAFMWNVADGQPSLLGLAPNRGLPSQHLSMLLVRSYRTFAPLPVPGVEPHEAIGGVFLWHSPHGHPHWALPSKSGHRGARTFLNQARLAKGNDDLIANTSPAFSFHHALRA